MTEIEVPLEQIQQDIEHAAHGEHGGSSQAWITWSALLSALLAVLAAVAALQAGHQVNEAMIRQMKGSDGWAYYQAKGIKASITESRIQMLEAFGKEVPQNLKEKIAKYGEEQKEIQETSKAHEEASEAHLHKHEIFAQAVTFYQIAIAVTAIAVVARRRQFLYVSYVFGLIGLYFLIQGFLAPGPIH